MSNPYEAPQRDDSAGRSRRKLLIGLGLGVVLLGTVIGIQWYRFQMMREEMLRALERAQAAEVQAREAEIRARQAAEESKRAEFIRQQQN